jgi:hypothetical protein
VSLPSLEFLKDQAALLVTYMGDKHRFRLKPASAYEALAAMYRQADWNTLRAMAERADVPAARVSLGASNGLSLPHRAPTNTFPLTWTHGRPDFTVNANDWFRHTMAFGGAKEDRRTWLQQHLVEHLDRGCAGVFINAFDGKMPEEVREELRSQGLLIELAEDEGPMFMTRRGALERSTLFEPQSPVSGGLALNLMADLDPDEVASLLLTLIFRTGENAGADFYRQAAFHMLSVVVHAMREAKLPVTLSGILSLFPDRRPDALLLLARSIDQDSVASKNLERLLATVMGNGEPIREKDWDLRFGVALHGLGRLANSAWVNTLFSDEAGTKGLFSLLQEGRCLVIEAPKSANGQPEKAAIHAMRAALSRRYMLSQEEKEQGWVFAFGEVDRYFASPLYRMAEMARRGRIALLMTAPSSSVPREFMDNVWNKLHLSGCSLDWQMELLEQRVKLGGPGDAEALAKSMVPDGVGDSKEWNSYAQTFLTSVLQRLLERNLFSGKDLLYYVQEASIAELTPLLAGTPAAAQLLSDRTFGSIRTIAANYLSTPGPVLEQPGRITAARRG